MAIEWHDSGIILSVARYGEADAIIDLLARNEGRYRGFVRGGLGRRQRGMVQPGNSVDAVWRARVDENLGNFRLEPETARAANIFHDPLRLEAMAGAAGLLARLLPEREPCPDIHAALEGLLDVLGDEDMLLEQWGVLLVRFEEGLLRSLGYGIDLSKCAATGKAEDLAYVSPKSGRAVSRKAGKPYHDKMLLLPAFLLNQDEKATAEDILAGLALTGYFLETRCLSQVGRTLPDARERLVKRFGKQAEGHLEKGKKTT